LPHHLLHLIQTILAKTDSRIVMVYLLPRAFVVNIKDRLKPIGPLCDASEKTIQSSAKRRCDIHGAWILTRTPLDKCTGPIVFSSDDNPSVHSKKRYGEMGSPCRIPLVGLKAFDRTPLILIEKETEVTHLITSETKVSANPSFSIIPLRYSHSTRSYAFAISSLIALARTIY
jgi:hypothetical protein